MEFKDNFWQQEA